MHQPAGGGLSSIKVKTMDDRTVQVPWNDEDETIADLKERIQASPLQHNAEEQIIIYNGQQLNNDKVVAELRLTKKSVIYVLHQPVGGAMNQPEGRVVGRCRRVPKFDTVMENR